MHQESLISKICSCLETLISGKRAESSPEKCNSKDEKEAIFYELKKNVHFAFEVIEKSDILKSSVKQYIAICHKKECKTCDYLNFLELSLVLLKILSEALLAEENSEALLAKGKEQGHNIKVKASVPKGLLSISQQKTVKGCLQFVVALGILPNLLHGIGVPLSKRLEYAKMLEHFTSDISPRQKHAEIAVCLDTLLSCIETTALQGIILSYHGTDLLAALFQLCYAPIKKIENKNFPEMEVKVCPDVPEKYFAMKLPIIKDCSFSVQQLVNEMIEDRSYFTPKLNRFLKRFSSSLLLWELLLFQGIPIRRDDSEFTVSRVPRWLRKICRQMSTNIILQRDGIKSFIRVVLLKAYDVDLQHDIERLDAVARLIVYNSITHLSDQDYTQLSKQVFDLLRGEGKQMDSFFEIVASSIILHTCDRDLKSGETHFLDILFEPLWMCVSTSSDPPLCDPKIVVTEKALTNCLEDIHKMFVLNKSPISRKHIKLLFPFFHCFSRMYIFLLKGVSSLKSKVKNLLLNILRCASDEDAISLLHAATFLSIVHENSPIYMTTVDFAYGEECGIKAVKRYEEDYFDLDVNCCAILELLTELKNKNLNRSFFLHILKVFCSYHNDVLQDPNDPQYERFQNLYSLLIEKLPQWDIDVREAVMSNVSEVVDIVIILIDLILKWEDDDYEETIMMVLMVLLNNMLFKNDELSSSKWESLKKCLPSLEKLMKMPINSSIKNKVFYVITSIATHGIAGNTPYEEILQKCFSKLYQESSDTIQQEFCDDIAGDLNHNNPEPGLSASTDSSEMKDLFENLSRADSSDKSSELASDLEMTLKLNRDLNKKIDEFTSFEKAIQDIKDSSIPIKGHGLIVVQKLLSHKDKETLCYKKELLAIFLEALDNDDSYVYLPTIKCLSLLADIDAELVFPTILKVHQNPGNKSTEYILKTGEVLSTICSCLGEHVYRYRDQLLHIYLIGAKHEDPRIRWSSLSNLGTACEHLKFNLSGHWQEILMCVQSLLKTDKNIVIRRCAALVIRKLLRGAGRDLLQILGNEMKDIYRQLKIVYTTETDYVLRLHSKFALEEINTIMRELLTVQLPLTKEIRILHHSAPFCHLSGL